MKNEIEDKRASVKDKGREGERGREKNSQREKGRDRRRGKKEK